MREGGREKKFEKENGERKKKEINMDKILTETNGQNLKEKREMERNGRKRDGERKKWRMRDGERKKWRKNEQRVEWRGKRNGERLMVK